MHFHAAETGSEGPGSEAESRVWSRLQEAFGSDDKGVAYYKYPVIDKAGNRFDNEPDFALLHKKIGLLVIECKGYTIDQVDQIQGHTWHLSGMEQERSTPYSQAREQGFFIQSWFNREQSLRDERGNCKIPVNFVVALPNITRKEWEDRGFHEIPSAPRVITEDELTPASLRDNIFDQPHAEELEDEVLRDGIAVLGGSQVISGKRNIPLTGQTKGDLKRTVEQGLKKFDEKQEAIGVEIPPGPQQIRGIAGSGKTVLLAKKAAHMHAKYPEWNIGVSFFTRSLYQTLEELINRFHIEMTGEEPDWDQLQILHGWGGKTTKMGIYYKIALQTELSPRNVYSAKELLEDNNGSPLELLDACCAELREEDLPEIFHAILIDEAQDFGTEFFNLCYEALKGPEKRLIWAYDEAQTLSNLSAPSPSEIFDEDEEGELRVDVSGMYKKRIRKSRVMRKSYRTPREVLMFGHALGMGLKREDGIIQTITNQRGWDRIGYEVDGEFTEVGNQVTVERPDEYSPHPLRDNPDARPLLRYNCYDEKTEEVDWVASEVNADINERGLMPEDILIIPLGRPDEAKGIGEKVVRSLAESGIETNKMWDEAKGDEFTRENEVSVSRVNRAKGNEASQVYLMNLEEIENQDRFGDIIKWRNQAFIGVSRAKAWCSVTGTGDSKVFDEVDWILDDLMEDRKSISFEVPSRSNLHREMESEEQETTLEDFE